MTDEEYKEMAICAIRRYLKSKDDNTTIESLYSLAIKRLIIKAKDADEIKISGVSQYSSDGLSYTLNAFEAFTITPDIAILLPNKPSCYAW